MIYDSPETEVADPAEPTLFESPATEVPSEPARSARRGSGAPDRARAVLHRITADPLQSALIAIPVLLLFVGAWTHRFINEDGFINFHVVQQITAGNGPVFNPGERVEAYTSPLFIVILSVVRLFLGWAISLPKIAVGVGIILTIAALIFGLLGASRMASVVNNAGAADGDDGSESDRRWLLVPVGALLIACTPPIWRWATSGLETSLSFFWLGVCFWGLARRYDQNRLAPEAAAANKPRWLLVFIGLGMLVRPEFILYTLVFLAAFALTSKWDWRIALRGLAWAAAIPILYQIFRMGYFASIVPNTAIAKGGDASHWDWGIQYAKQFLGAQWTWIAVIALLVLVGVVARQASHVDRGGLIVVLAPIAGAALHLLYIQKVGGDYMYARFYVPTLFALALPVMVVSIPRPRREYALSGSLIAVLAASTVLVLWSLIAAVNGKYTTVVDDPVQQATKSSAPAIIDSSVGLGFGDYGMLLPGSVNPVEAEDYGFMVASVDGVLGTASKQPDILIDSTDANHKPIPLKPGQGIVVKSGAIGVTSFAAGPDIWIVDDRGLADPVAARLYPNTPFGYAGHEKLLSWEWVVARWAPPSQTDGPKVDHIRRLNASCENLQNLTEATTEPMSIGRFVKNISLSKNLSSLRLFDDPRDTEKWICAPNP